jgi:hypothetical protein
MDVLARLPEILTFVKWFVVGLVCVAFYLYWLAVR